ncbi:LuxR C-terminal-related transcriptional regulator, partial [Enhygromyxa salina]|uniref:LuxR C-terminal-related transcriptional regulator n=1 Tax=Enhygromyxa salina TaxID=215803 RepID=UPI001C625F99
PHPASGAPQTRTRRDPTTHGVRVSAYLRQLVDAATEAFAFTQRERHVLHHVLYGRSTQVIAARLRIRETSVHKHMHRIFAATQTNSRKRLLDLALRLAARRSASPAPRGLRLV